MLPLLAGGLGTLAAVIWISVPALQSWSLQLAALLVLLYILTVRLAGKRWSHVLPPKHGLQSGFLTAAAGILVGSTGGTQSPFFLLLPLTVFFCTLTLSAPAVIAQTAGLSLILWIAEANSSHQIEWSALLLLPALLPIALLARSEMESARQSQHAQWVATQKHENQSREAMIFLMTVVGPKIQTIHLFLQQSADNRDQAALQLKTLEEDIRAYAHELEENT